MSTPASEGSDGSGRRFQVASSGVGRPMVCASGSALAQSYGVVGLVFVPTPAHFEEVPTGILEVHGLAQWPFGRMLHRSVVGNLVVLEPLEDFLELGARHGEAMAEAVGPFLLLGGRHGHAVLRQHEGE